MTVLTTLSVFTLMVLVSAKYNCNNEGPNGCLYGGHCTYFGNCECSPGYTGHNCGLQLAHQSYGIGCNTECVNGGTCYNGTFCFCPVEFYGDRCQHRREYVKCGIEGMEITILVPTRFTGEIITKPNLTDCPFQEYSSEMTTQFRTFKFITPLSLLPSNPCSSAINRTVTPDNVTYTVDVAVSEKKGIYNPLTDRIVRFKCDYPRRAGSGSTNDITHSFTPVVLQYLDKTKQPLAHGVQEGEIFYIDFAPTVESDANGVQVVSLEAFSVHSGKVITFKMVEKGCILETAKSRVKSMELVSGPGQDGSMVYKTRIEMTAFSLHGNSYLHFNYDLKYCHESCTPIICTKPTMQPKPKRLNRFGPGLNIVI